MSYLAYDEMEIKKNKVIQNLQELKNKEVSFSVKRYIYMFYNITVWSERIYYLIKNKETKKKYFFSFEINRHGLLCEIVSKRFISL